MTNNVEDAWGKHAERVAALARRIGENLRLAPDDLATLEEAARRHHSALELLEESALSRLLADVLGNGQLRVGTKSAIRPSVRQAVLGFHGAEVPLESQKLSEILTIADALDQELELEPYSEELRIPAESAQESPIVSAGLACLRKATRADLAAAIPRLPVFPAAALKAIKRLVSEDLSAWEIETIAGQDPVFASRIIAAANSALNSPAFPLKTLRQAIVYLGIPRARSVLLSATLLPLFSTPHLNLVWRHSVECAEIARQLADTCGALGSAEAFLGGLVHDIGALALALLPKESLASLARLRELGCSGVSAEWVTLGFNHAEAGAQVLESYRFPSELVEAVRHHHAPERECSLLTATLYIAEFWSGSDEDLPSAARVRMALARLGLTMEDLQKLKATPMLV